jgi:hypothetical protein
VIRSRMKKTNPYNQKDFVRDEYKTAARDVVNTVKDPTELHQKAVKTQEAEVRSVLSRQSREFCSFAYRGGRHEVWRVVNYINVKQKVVSQPIANYINVELDDTVKHVVAEDMLRPLSLSKDNVTMHSNDFNDGEMLVMYCVVMEVVAVEYVEVEDTLSPLSLTKDSVMMCSCDDDNTEKEEVLAELTEQLRVFPPISGLRGGRAEGRGEAHCEGADRQGQQGVQGGLADFGCFGRCRGSASFDPRLPGVLDANQSS